MRDDMAKVIVERPRRGGGVQGDGRLWRNSRDRGSHLGMRRGHASPKGLNENLAPLRRWLGRQVNRPWDAVYSELSAGIDRRNAVQAHVLEHLDQMVERGARMVDGLPCVWDRWPARGAWTPLRELPRIALYVHPVTGLLRENRIGVQVRERERERRARHGAAGPAVERREIDPFTQWHRRDGLWFEVRLAELPAPDDPHPMRWDALRRCEVRRGHDLQGPHGQPGHVALYGRRGVYAEAKRQLGARELQRAGVA